VYKHREQMHLFLNYTCCVGVLYSLRRESMSLSILWLILFQDLPQLHAPGGNWSRADLENTLSGTIKFQKLLFIYYIGKLYLSNLWILEKISKTLIEDETNYKKEDALEQRESVLCNPKA
jgi:hypothetical protein